MTTFREARDFLLAHREDYEAAYRDFRWPDEKQFNWALDWFDGVLARENPDGLALWIVDAATGAEARFTFGELARRSNIAANYFRQLGVRRGDRLLLLLSNVPALWEVMLAAMKLGAVVIPATTLLTADDLRDRLSRGRVAHIVAAAEHAGKFAGLAKGLTRIAVGGAPGWHSYEEAEGADTFTPDAPTQASDPLLLYFTSGTTAKPKLVLHSHRSYPAGHLTTMYWLGVKPGDIHLNISSPGWAKHAWSCFFAPWNGGAAVFILNQTRFEAKTLLDHLARCRVTTLCAPPTVWRMLVQEDLKSWRLSLREVLGAGEPLNPEIMEQIQAAWGLTVRDGYGQTETTLSVGNPPGARVKPGSMGRPMPGYRVGLLDPEGTEVDEGEVALPAAEHRPAGLMLGYAMDQRVIGTDAEWYRSGDVALRDADGYFTFVGRADDVFKSSDYRISPFELESVLIEHEAVAEAAVIPAPDPIRLAVPKAYVSLVAGAEPSRETALSIFRYLHSRLAPFKRVRRIEIVTDLPKTISGKIRRVQLRAIEQGRDAGEGLRGHEFSESDFPELRQAG
jgi:acetyl-CoA synthetase